MRPPEELSIPEHPTEADAERACDAMREHLERAQRVVDEYRNILSDVPPARKRDRRN